MQPIHLRSSMKVIVEKIKSSHTESLMCRMQFTKTCVSVVLRIILCIDANAMYQPWLYQFLLWMKMKMFEEKRTTRIANKFEREKTMLSYPCTARAAYHFEMKKRYLYTTYNKTTRANENEWKWKKKNVTKV